MTLVILSITLSYSVRRFMVMNAYEDTNHILVDDPFMNDVRSLSQAESNFNFGFGVFNQEKLVLDDFNGYLDVVVSQFSWGIEGNTVTSEIKEL